MSGGRQTLSWIDGVKGPWARWLHGDNGSASCGWKGVDLSGGRQTLSWMDGVKGPWAAEG